MVYKDGRLRKDCKFKIRLGFKRYVIIKYSLRDILIKNL